LDEIDDIIMIHDSNHTVVWVNRAGLKMIGKRLEEVCGQKCYRIFGRSCCCEDCAVASMKGAPVKSRSLRSFPAVGQDEYECITVPLFKDGRVEVVVQHLKKACPVAGNP
jgi:PAS domain-containing protein